ncbi:MAG: DUF1579 domain-containing protein [Verrucomicrobiota bacterium]
MKTSIITIVSAVALCCCARVSAQAPAMPEPVKEHEFLKQFAGEWTVETQLFMEPGKPPVTVKGTESAKMLGGFWVVGETKCEMMGQPFTGIMSLGYDPEKKKYTGTWIDSMTSTLWTYTGSVDETGKILTLECAGKCPMDGKFYQMRDTTEWKSPDQRVMKNERKGEDGKWVTGMTSTATRK